MNVEKLNVTELNAQEMRTVEGGSIRKFLGGPGGLLLEIAMEIIDGSFFSDMKKSYNQITQK